MKTVKINQYLLSILLLLLAGCGGGSDNDNSNNNPPPSDPIAALEADISTALDNVSTDADFTLLIKAPNGRVYSHSVGTSSTTTVYESASTSKMVTAAVILSLVNDGVLTLDDNPQNFIGSWPTTGNLSQIKLRHLLSFTSGLNTAPLCINNPFTTMAACVDQIAADNAGALTPGTEFYYGSAHMQVAGLMAINAVGAANWGEVFANFKADTGLFSNSVYDLPSLQNPRLAGGMHWIATDYLEFLQALHEGTILSPTLISQMTSDQINGTTIGLTPIDIPGENWHYGFGGWIECHNVVFNCTTTTKYSSPGAYGAYPFVDFDHDYFGILARQGNLGTGSNGYEVFFEVESQLQQWAALNQN